MLTQGKVCGIHIDTMNVTFKQFNESKLSMKFYEILRDDNTPQFEYIL